MKSSKIIFLFFFCLLLLNFQCDDDDDDDDVQTIMCDTEVIVDNSVYQAVEASFYSIVTSEIDGDCLAVNIAASGCGGETWVLTLIDSEDIAESMPPQRYLKLSLFNNEACLAIYNKIQSFNLTLLRIDGVNEVVLNIEDFPEPLIYAY